MLGHNLLKNRMLLHDICKKLFSTMPCKIKLLIKWEGGHKILIIIIVL